MIHTEMGCEDLDKEGYEDLEIKMASATCVDHRMGCEDLDKQDLLSPMVDLRLLSSKIDDHVATVRYHE